MLKNILMTRQFLYLNGLIVMNARVFMNCVLLLPVIQFGFCVFFILLLLLLLKIDQSPSLTYFSRGRRNVYRDLGTTIFWHISQPYSKSGGRGASFPHHICLIPPRYLIFRRPCSSSFSSSDSSRS